MTCEEVIKKNLGLSRCKLPAMLLGMITLPAGTEITAANFQSLAAWRSLTLNPYSTRAYLWPWFRSQENLSEETVYESTPLSTMKVRDGRYQWRVSLKESLCLHTKLYTHNSEGDVDVILIDVEGNFIGTVADSGNIKGFSIDLINAEKLLLSDGTVSTKTPIYISLRDNKEMDINGVMYKNTFAGQIYRITDVEITDVSHTLDDERVVDFKTACDGIGVTGLLAADILVLNAAGVSVGAVTTAVEDANVPGRYTLTKANSFVVGGSVTLRAAASLTVKPYEGIAMDDIVSVS